MDTHSNTFIHRILRLLAWLGLMYASAQVVGWLVELLEYGPRVLQGRLSQLGIMGPIGRFGSYAAAMLSLGAIALLLTGAIGLLKWRTWSRPTLIAWAVVQICATFTTQVTYLAFYVAVRRGTTQPVSPSLAGQALTTMLWAVTAVAFPLLVLGILRQPEVKDLWARAKMGGFEVIPVARIAQSQEPPQD